MCPYAAGAHPLENPSLFSIMQIAVGFSPSEVKNSVNPSVSRSNDSCPTNRVTPPTKKMVEAQ